MRYLIALLVLTILALAISSCRPRPDAKATYTPAQGTGAPTAISGNAPQSPPADIPADQTAPPPTDGEQATGTEGEAATDSGNAKGTATPEGGESGEKDDAKEANEDSSGEEETKPKEEEPVKPKIIPARELPLRMTNVTTAMFETNRGNFIINIYPEIAPISAAHFINLIRQGFYDNILIHRYEPGFVIQMGQVISEDGNNTNLYPNDPKKAQLASITIQDEPCMSENTDMTVSFAKTSAPNSASSQFFVNLGDNRRLDNYNTGFTVMGLVIHGQDVVRKLRERDRIGRAYLIQPPRDVS